MDRERTGDICHPVHRGDARLTALRGDAARKPARPTSALNASPKSAGVLAQLDAGRARPQRPKPMTRAYTRALSGRTKAGVWFGAHDTLAADETRSSVRVPSSRPLSGCERAWRREVAAPKDAATSTFWRLFGDQSGKIWLYRAKIHASEPRSTE